MRFQKNHAKEFPNGTSSNKVAYTFTNKPECLNIAIVMYREVSLYETLCGSLFDVKVIHLLRDPHNIALSIAQMQANHAALGSQYLRTFVEVLRATAQEKGKFADAFNSGDSEIALVPYSGSNDLWSLKTDKGSYLVQPVLRLNRENLADLLLAKQDEAKNLSHLSYSTLTSVHYGSRDYVLGDLMDENGVPVEHTLRYKDGRLDSLLTSNKEVFLLISELYSDISIDPKNLPVQQFIQTQ